MSNAATRLDEFKPPVERELNENMEDAFYGDTTREAEIKHEKPKHRLAVFMAIHGATNVEIAEHLGLTPVHVGDILKQPWARARLIKETRDIATGLKAKLEKEGMRSLNNVIEMANSAATKQEVKLKANIEIIEHWIGKAPATVTHFQGKSEELTDEELDKRIAERQAQISN